MPNAIGPYRIVRQIGRGGMGIVYEAVDERLRRAVAIKTILPSSDPVIRDRFLREARSAAAVSHPHICQLFEIGEHEGNPFLAMELLDGESLGMRLERGPLGTSEAISIMLGILSALDALHRRGIVHRDLKPSNIFLTAHGVKLLDFGLARPVAIDADTTSLTMPGLLLGTPRYMAPEQARGAEIDARADIFAAGAILFEMLSGRPAFHGESPVEALHAVLHDHPPALVGSLAVVDVDRVIQRAMAKMASARFQTADDMARELRACLSRGDAGQAAVARTATRLLVLPFRPGFTDPEGWFYWAHSSAAIHDDECALALLERTVDGGMCCVRGLETSPSFDRLRTTPRFANIVARARSGHAAAARAFADADGHRLLGLPLV